MNSEEDTFNRLRRIPYEEMRNIYMSDDKAIISHSGYIEYTKKLFEKYGWTIKDYWENP